MPFLTGHVMHASHVGADVGADIDAPIYQHRCLGQCSERK